MRHNLLIKTEGNMMTKIIRLKINDTNNYAYNDEVIYPNGMGSTVN
jgi:hypothetical protein